jgi:general L-amino acid transport system permease protein
MAVAFQPAAARPAPVRTEGFVPWIRANLFANGMSTVTTVVLIVLAVYLTPGLVKWAYVDAVFRPDADACQAARGMGACWGVVTEKWRLIVLGRFPYDAQWRPAIAGLLLVSLVLASGMRRFWSPWLIVLWIVVIAAFFVLMGGGWFGLSRVPTDNWGGLPLTIMLATFGIALAFPLSILVALGRRSQLPAIRTACIVYVELIRGVPLISVLFMASFLFPLFLPVGKSPDVLVRVLAGITLFSAAYLAETVRGGLQAIPKGQVEAAQSLGLSYWQTQRKIVLPQALALVVPAIVNTFIGIFKDTSLVTIVSLFELTGGVQLALNSDANWRPFKIEGYIFITLIYFAFCFAMSRYGLWVEKQLGKSRDR